jgi:hypothetical protein
VSRNLTFAVVILVLAAISISSAQTLKNLVHPPPDGVIVGFLMTDGTVVYQGNAQSDWWRLTPDKSGSYVKGTWKQLASLPSGYVPLYFAAAVLADGRLIIEGGEYNFGSFSFTNLGAVYDPAKDTWTKQKPPQGWGFIGDSPSTVLPDGHFLLGSKFDRRIAELDPVTLTWTELSSAGKKDRNAEEGWTLMPDGTVVTYDVTKAPHSEKYDPAQQKWISLGSTIVDLHSPTTFGCIPYGKHGQYCYYPPGEVGPGMLQPDGTVFATGSYSTAGPGHTAVYHPSTGKWTVGPDFPNGDNAGDSYAVLLPNGHPLVVGASGASYEFDGKNLNAGPFLGYFNHLLVLPTGEVIVGGSVVFTPSGKPNPAWAPSVTQYPHTVTRGSTYKISGTQFNGLSQAQAFGDELESVTNYPLVRITNKASGHVAYAKTHDHSSMGVATGSTIVSTNFDVPSGMETGASTLEVVANGIPSKKVAITVN